MKRATSCPMVSIFGSNISIHALMKRATSMSGVGLSEKIISIHALMKRATSSHFGQLVVYLFQSTPS